MNSKEIIKRNFSRFADRYDSYCNIQNYVAASLIELSATDHTPQRILDIGCGPGNYTMLLTNKFPAADITAVDISENMVNIAKAKLPEKNITFLTADAETVDFPEKFDLITSNASFQWLSDLSTSLNRFKNMLAEKSYILFSIFGPETFCQLNQALTELYQADIPLTSLNFAPRQTVEKVITQNFQDVHIAEELIKKDYKSLWELFNTIKYTGTCGVGLKGKHLGKERIEQLEKIYIEKFGSITVTYQIFYCRAKKRSD